MLTFEKTFPEEAGIPSQCIIHFINRLNQRKIPMHSLLLMRHDKLVFEGYYAPYTADTLHRMFSVSKSFTSIAVGLLADEGKLSLDDPIVRYFPEKLPDKVHPWISSMTILDMLMMRTCHAKTTYKLDMDADWVESFFITPPTHPPGKLFHYDTSAAHTLCALTEKLTGVPMLDYLKDKLAPLSLSEQSYMLKDPFGVSLGGTGLTALPADLLRFGYFIAHRGFVAGQQLISPAYIDMAVSLLSETRVTAPIPGEAQGYGLQFWRGKENGYTCYGMGGQLIIFLPDQDMICVTTADTQGIGGGNQQIYDALYEEILPFVRDEALPSAPESSRLLKSTAASLRIEPLETSLPTESMQKVNDKRFTVQAPDSVFESFCVHFEGPLYLENRCTGCLSFVFNHKTYQLPFGMNSMQTGLFPLYDQRYAASGAWLSDGTLYIKAHIIDAYVGSVHFQLSFGQNDLTVFMRKQEESLFQEFNGHLYCVLT